MYFICNWFIVSLTFLNHFFTGRLGKYKQFSITFLNNYIYTSAFAVLPQTPFRMNFTHDIKICSKDRSQRGHLKRLVNKNKQLDNYQKIL